MKASLKHLAALIIFLTILSINLPFSVQAEAGVFQETNRITAYDIAAEGGYVYIVGDAVNLEALAGRSLDLRGGLRDIWLVKLDRDGTPVFTALIGGADNDSAYSIAVRAGVVYILGETWSVDFPGAPGNAGENDAVLLALSADGGQILWARRFGGSDQDSGRALTLHDNALYLTGITWSDDLLPGAANGNADGFLARVRLDGTLDWLEIFGGSGLDAPYDLMISEENIWAAGQSSSRDFGGTHQGEGDAFAARFSLNGEEQFAQLYGGREVDVAFAISSGEDGGVLLAGGTRSATPPTAIGEYGGNYDGFLMSLSPEGELRRTNYFGGTDVDYAYDICNLPGGDVIVVGETFSPTFPLSYDDPQPTNGGGDAFILKLDSDGELVAEFVRGSSAADHARAGVITSRGLWLAGNFTVGVLPYALLIPPSELGDITLPTTEPIQPTATTGPTATPQPTETPLPTITPTLQPTNAETATAVGESVDVTPTGSIEKTDTNEAIQEDRTPGVESTGLVPANPTETLSAEGIEDQGDGSTSQENEPSNEFPIGLVIGGGLLLVFVIAGVYYFCMQRKQKDRSE